MSRLYEDPVVRCDNTNILFMDEGYLRRMADVQPRAYPMLTLSTDQKWYKLYLIQLDGDGVDEVVPVSFMDLDDLELPLCESPFLDHAPNPVAIKMLCEQNGWHMGPIGWELICGRWACEYFNLKWTVPPELEP